jgi:hypothetical protein
MVFMDTLIVAAISFVAGSSMTGIVSHLCYLSRRVKELEQAQAKHLPYRTADEIEDATAAILTLKLHNELRGEFIDNALGHLQNARSGNTK